MKTCPDCGERVYNLGCVNCNEAAYIDEQIALTARYGESDDDDDDRHIKETEPVAEKGRQP